MAQEIARFCPRCGTTRIGSFRYCGSCAFDFDEDPQHPVNRAAIWPEELDHDAGSVTDAAVPTIAGTAVPGPEAAVEPGAEPPSGTLQVVAPAPLLTPTATASSVPIVPTAPASVSPIPISVPDGPSARPSAPAPALARVDPVVALRAAARAAEATPATRFARAGRWPVYMVGALAILLVTGALLVSVLMTPRSAAAPPQASAPVRAGSPALASVAPGRSRIVISEPENGARIPAESVTFQGTGPAGFELIHDAATGQDARTTIAPDGTWTLVVGLEAGANEVRLRLGDDRSTELIWTVTSVAPAGSGQASPAGPVAFEPVTLRGTGTRVAEFSIPEAAVAVATISHRGPGAFAVWTLDANANQMDQLVNATGDYDGRRLFDVDTHAVGFRVEAGGNWTIVVRPISAATTWDGTGTLEGTGSDVFVLDPPASDFRGITMRHVGRGVFVVVGYSGVDLDLHANASGDYFGESLLREGTNILAIEAGGSWTIVLD
jgi:hypothetical protein